MKITHTSKKVGDCSKEECEECFALLTKLFAGITKKDFLRDLSQKERIILLHDKEISKIVGFSTLTTWKMKVGSEEVSLIFSGDTAVDPRARSATGLGLGLLGYFEDVMKRSQNRVYYGLISKGWRTYRILDRFFQNYYPHYSRSSQYKEVARIFGRTFFDDRFDERTGVLSSSSGDSPRVICDQDVQLPSTNDRASQFFLEMNPNYRKGDELVCIAEVCSDNFTRLTNRILLRGGLV